MADVSPTKENTGPRCWFVMHGGQLRGREPTQLSIDAEFWPVRTKVRYCMFERSAPCYYLDVNLSMLISAHLQWYRIAVKARLNRDITELGRLESY